MRGLVRDLLKCWGRGWVLDLGKVRSCVKCRFGERFGERLDESWVTGLVKSWVTGWVRGHVGGWVRDELNRNMFRICTKHV